MLHLLIIKKNDIPDNLKIIQKDTTCDEDNIETEIEITNNATDVININLIHCVIEIGKNLFLLESDGKNMIVGLL